MMTPAELHATLGLMRNPYGRDPQQVRDAILKAADELERQHSGLRDLAEAIRDSPEVPISVTITVS
jgi:hypothetical protein